MKIGKITRLTTQGAEESYIELQGWKVFAGLISAGLITGIIAGLTFLFIDLPTNEQDRNLTLRKEKFEILNFVLRSKSDEIRKESLLFLIHSEILVDEEGELIKLIEGDVIPDWSEMPEYKHLFDSGVNPKTAPTAIPSVSGNTIDEKNGTSVITTQ